MVQIAVVGCGHWGRNLVRNYASLGVLHSICDAEDTVTTALSAEFKIPVLDFNSMLIDPGLDGVVIATPAATHAELVMATLRARKRVFVEKPICLNHSDAYALRELSVSADIPVMVGHLLQYHPAFIQLQKMVDEGVLGKLDYISSSRLNLGKFRQVEDSLWSFAPHDISMILALAGERPASVSSVGHSALQEGIADVSLTHFTFPSGLSGHIHVSWLHPYKEQKLVVIGSKGMAVFDDSETWDRKLMLYADPVNWDDGGHPSPRRQDGQAIPLVPEEPLLLECRHFVDCVENGQAPLTDIDEGIRVLEVLISAEKSMKSKGAVEIMTASALT